MKQPCRILVVGIGSMLGDDQAGWIAAEHLAILNPPGNEIEIRMATVPLDLLDWLDNIHQLHVIDACKSEQPSGTIHRLNTNQVCGESNDKASVSSIQLGGQTTHDYGLPDVLRLGVQTMRLPQMVVVWAIDGKQFQLGDKISNEVRMAAATVADRIITEANLTRPN